jgi:hypothetical protein
VVSESDHNHTNINQKRGAVATQTDNSEIPEHFRNGLGQPRKNQALVLAVKAHAVYKAYVRGRGGIEPSVPGSMAETLLDACRAVQEDIDGGLYSLEDVEGLTRAKTLGGKPFLLIYIKTDVVAYLANKNKPQAEKPYDSKEDRGHLDYIVAHAKS